MEFLRLLDHGISTDPEYRGTGGGTGEGCLLADCMPIDASCEDLEVYTEYGHVVVVVAVAVVVVVVGLIIV